MAREPFDINFCIFTGCSQLQKNLCIREECWVNDVMVLWWKKHLYPNPLVTSNPPKGYHMVYNIYAKIVKGKYQPVFIVEDTPQS